MNSQCPVIASMPSRLPASTMSAPCMASASPLPCHRSPPSSRTELPAPASRAQPVDQRLQMGEAAHAAVAMRGFLIIEEGEGVRRRGCRARCRNAREMRWPTRCGGWPRHRADADIDARLAEIDRQKLRVACRSCAARGHCRSARYRRGRRRPRRPIRGTTPESDAAARTFNTSRRRIATLLDAVSGQRMTAFFQAVACSLAWAMDALASASASWACLIASSKFPASAAFFAAFSSVSVVVHWFLSAPA